MLRKKYVAAWHGRGFADATRCGVSMTNVREKSVNRLVLGLGLGVALAIATQAPLAAAASSGVTIPGAPNCYVFPADNVWNMRVDSLPVASDSATMVASIGSGAYLHPDFSSINGGNYGIPYNVVGAAVAGKKVKFQYAGQSDPGSISNPQGCQDRGRFRSPPAHRHRGTPASSTSCSRRAKHRPVGRQAPGRSGTCLRTPCGRQAGRVPTRPDCRSCRAWCATTKWPPARSITRCALRHQYPHAYIYPARHYASDSTDQSLPPMGLRVRLKASFDISRLRTAGPGPADCAQALRHDPGRQRLTLVRDWRAGRRLERRRPPSASAAPRLRFRGCRHFVAA